MSAEHVAAMNAALRDSAEVRAACAALSGPLTLAYRLTDGPDGGDVHWRTEATDTVRFSLDQAGADVTYVGDWSQTVRAMLAARNGGAAPPPLRIEGRSECLVELAPVLQIAAAVATFPVDAPEGLR